MNELLLSWLVAYGPLAILPVLASAAIGVPLPATLLLLAAGAFAAGGELAPVPLVLAGVAGAVGGDLAGFAIGRRGGGAAVARWGRSGATAASLARAEQALDRWGGAAVVLTRCVITPLGPVVNLTAGAAGYPAWRFAVYGLVGETIWVLTTLGAGALLGAAWESVLPLVSGFGQALALLVLAVGLGALLYRFLRRDHGAGAEAPAAVDATALTADAPAMATAADAPHEGSGVLGRAAGEAARSTEGRTIPLPARLRRACAARSDAASPLGPPAASAPGGPGGPALPVGPDGPALPVGPSNAAPSAVPSAAADGRMALPAAAALPPAAPDAAPPL